MKQVSESASRFYTGTVLILSLLLFFSSCEFLANQASKGVLTLPDFSEYQSRFGGELGGIDYGGKTINLGTRAVEQVKLQNTGTGPLTIDDVYIEGTGFEFADNNLPDLPFTIPEGSSIDGIFVEFNPQSGGLFSGKLFIEANNQRRFVSLDGIGLWQLTLSVAAAGADSNGKITSPVVVLPAETEILTSPTGIFQLACEIEPLSDLVGWRVDAAAIAPEFENQTALNTEVQLFSHTEISLEILVTWALVQTPAPGVPHGFVSIQDAIGFVEADPAFVGVAVSEFYVSTNDTAINLPAGVKLHGGYVGGFGGDRFYKTPQERIDYLTRITAPITVSGDAVDNNVMIEGFIINNTVTVSNGSPALVQYNTITGPTPPETPIGLLSTTDATPLIRFNIISGGSTSADYSESYGLYVSEGSTPVIYDNVINGGQASGTGSESFAVFSDFECEVLLTGNTITGGTAPDSAGKSYGVYMINNGKIFAGYNNISGGSAATAYGMYVAYGGNLYLDYNNIHNNAGATTRHAVYVGAQGRVRRMLNNGLYDSPDSLLYFYLPHSVYTTIDDVNDYFHTDSNSGSAITIEIPDSPEY
jgi:parallel beta helix pectate lyase-like protein